MDHKVFNIAVENGVFVIATLGELDEVVDCARGPFGLEFNVEVSEVRDNTGVTFNVNLLGSEEVIFFGEGSAFGRGMGGDGGGC